MDKDKTKRDAAIALNELIAKLVDDIDLMHDEHAPMSLRAKGAYIKIDSILTRIVENCTEDDLRMLIQLAETLDAREEARR